MFYNDRTNLVFKMYWEKWLWWRTRVWLHCIQKVGISLEREVKMYKVCLCWSISHCDCQDQRLLIQENHRELQDSWGEDVITLEDKGIGQHRELSGLRHSLVYSFISIFEGKNGKKKETTFKNIWI
jgi:hypothetical protein